MLHQSLTTIPAEVRDFAEWHHGRRHYAVWVLRCEDNPAIQAKFKAARAHLNGYLLEPYDRQPHITLFVCCFLAATAHYNDDFTQMQVDAQIQALGSAHLEPFEIEINGLKSFASAPFLEVHDPDGGITRLRAVLSGGAPEFRTTPYRPHLTVGLYASAFPSQDVLARMAVFMTEPIRWRVEQVSLATYQASEIVGKLNYRYRYGLKT
jgi:2'-5' RNA ligase